MKQSELAKTEKSALTRENDQNYLNIKVDVYREMQDQTESEIDVLALIQQQFEQIKMLNHKRSFLLKDISEYIVK